MMNPRKGHTVEADRAWAQNRISNFLRGQRVLRKASGDPAHDSGEGHDANVSKPGEPAEKQAGSLADHVADELHGGGDKGALGHAGAAKEAAPAIGAKLEAGAISLAKKGGGGAAPAWTKLAVSSSRKTHILVGGATGGGHAPHATVAGKTKLPAEWTDDKIITAIETVANTAAN